MVKVAMMQGVSWQVRFFKEILTANRSRLPVEMQANDKTKNCLLCQTDSGCALKELLP